MVAIEARVVAIEAWGGCYRGQGWLLKRQGVVATWTVVVAIEAGVVAI